MLFFHSDKKVNILQSTLIMKDQQGWWFCKVWEFLCQKFMFKVKNHEELISRISTGTKFKIHRMMKHKGQRLLKCYHYNYYFVTGYQLKLHNCTWGRTQGRERSFVQPKQHSLYTQTHSLVKHAQMNMSADSKSNIHVCTFYVRK